MDAPHRSRREFMSASAGMLGGGWLWLNMPIIVSLSACARDAAVNHEPFTFLTPDEGRTMRAFAARIIPSDDGNPGAEEAGAAWFADAALDGPFADMAPPVRGGLADLDERARAAHGTAFADLDAAQQDAIMGDVVDTPFFFLGRLLVVAGVFSDPSWHGNRGRVGDRLLGIDHAAAYQPPFGYYDAEYARTNGGVS
jgi:gluconate 2-dehydrogenase gamma chain